MNYVSPEVCVEEICVERGIAESPAFSDPGTTGTISFDKEYDEYIF